MWRPLAALAARGASGASGGARTGTGTGTARGASGATGTATGTGTARGASGATGTGTATGTARGASGASGGARTGTATATATATARGASGASGGARTGTARGASGASGGARTGTATGTGTARGASGASGTGTGTATGPGTAAPARRRPLLLPLLARPCSCGPARRARRAWQRGGPGDGTGSGSGSGTGSGTGGGWGWGRGWWRSGGGRGRSGQPGPRRLMAALATGAFVWDGQRIEEEELRRSAQELQQLEQPERCREQEPWELVMERERFRLWRRPIPGSGLFQYRVFGSYTDVTPRQFFNVQLDTEYRKQWDALVLKLEVLERDPASGSELVHWVTQFPYPMYSRDYVYVRRYSVDSERNLMVLVSRSVEHPGIPEEPEHVRVRSYESRMVIRPHRGFDENGFDYLLTYSDNPQTVFPRYCLSWMVSSGMPEFLEKLHAAALKAKRMELEVRDYLSPAPKGPEPRAAAARLEYA